MQATPIRSRSLHLQTVQAAFKVYTDSTKTTWVGRADTSGAGRLPDERGGRLSCLQTSSISADNGKAPSCNVHVGTDRNVITHSLSYARPLQLQLHHRCISLPHRIAPVVADAAALSRYENQNYQAHGLVIWRRRGDSCSMSQVRVSSSQSLVETSDRFERI